MKNNLIFHYQNVLHNKKDGIFVHEAFSTRDGELYSIDPLPTEVSGDTEEEVEESLRSMEADSLKYKAVNYKDLAKQMERWVDEVSIDAEAVIPQYEDEDALEEDFYDTEGKVLDLVDFMERNNKR